MVALVAKEPTVPLVSRTGRHLQRYCQTGLRQVVGCIPYRLKEIKQQTEFEIDEEDIEVLLISSQKGKGMLFPKGGWETDESKEQAASRETVEEAGVTGLVERELGTWKFKSKSHDTYYEGIMFSLLVKEQLEIWPEKNVRKRTWMSVAEARKACQYLWMKEALDRLVEQRQQRDEEKLVHHSL
ncbi:nudix hydrolase 18, mitochondrial-like [Mangifera indica]|uniref:nudix hydrolase 18, mitochondrial-like n=1 Tax=Mangifera indica TaxID=29780 RepID=UPI001CFB1086|nr:nudix hydrolase 18, mitochondrial-like [Mangifera indica]